MSTIKTNNVQLGQSLTASQNFTWYQPASPDGTVRLGNGNAGSVTDLITVGTTGNLTFANSISLSAASTKTLTLNGGAGSNGLVIDASNNVGIGGSPAVKLDVRSGSIGTQAFFGYGTGLATVSSNTGVATFAGNTSFSSSYVAYAQYTAASSIDFSSDGSIRLYTDSGLTSGSAFSRTERLRLDASGNLGLGVTPPSGANTSGFYPRYGVAIGLGYGLQLGGNTYWDGNWKYITTGNYSARYDINAGNLGTHAWFTANTTSGTAGNAISFNQAMTLDASGHLTLNSGGGIKFVNGAGSLSTTTNGDGAAFGYVSTGLILQGKGSSFDVCLRNNSAGVAGYVATGATTITTSSDERLKENLEPIVNAISKIEQIRAVTGNYKADPDRNVAFLIAQDVDKVFPQAVEKADNNSWGINYNWVIPLLAAAIQELHQEIETLKQKVNV